MGIIINKEIIASSGGGMNASIYDPQNKQIDIYDYADERNFIIKIGSTDEGVSVGNSKEERVRNKIISPEGLSLKGLYNKINDNQNIILELIGAPMGDFGIENRLILNYYSVNEYGGNDGIGFKFSNDYFEAEMVSDGYIYIWRKQEPLYELPEDIGVQPDWNQNDETQPDYVKNRTHWSEKDEVLWEVSGVIFENLSVVCTEGSFSGSYEEGIGWIMLEWGGIPVEAGKTYRVIWDGVDYVCTVKVDEYGEAYIGGTGTPFWMHRVGFGVNDSPGSGTVTHTLTMYEEIEEVHKLDVKYLPEFVINVECSGNDGSIEWYTPDATMMQINEAYDADQHLILKVASWIVDEDYYRIPLTSCRISDRVYTFECDDFAVKIVPADASEPDGEASIVMIRGAVASEDNGELFRVDFYWNDDGVTTDTTYADVLEALNAGKMVVGFQGERHYILSGGEYTPSGVPLQFVMVQDNFSGVEGLWCRTIYLSEDGVIGTPEYEIPSYATMTSAIEAAIGNAIGGSY